MDQITLPDAQLELYTNWLSLEQALPLFNQLRDDIDWQQPQIKLFGRETPIPRLQAWLGDAGLQYSYSGLAMTAMPWTPSLRYLRDQLQQTTGLHFNSCLLNYYRDGNDSMGAHADDEPELGPNPHIALLSLGAERILRFVHKQRGFRIDLPLPSGSLLLMRGSTQHYWQHQIPKQRRVKSARISLTFRRISHASPSMQER